MATSLRNWLRSTVGTITLVGLYGLAGPGRESWHLAVVFILFVWLVGSLWSLQETGSVPQALMSLVFAAMVTVSFALGAVSDEPVGMVSILPTWSVDGSHGVAIGRAASRPDWQTAGLLIVALTAGFMAYNYGFHQTTVSGNIGMFTGSVVVVLAWSATTGGHPESEGNAVLLGIFFVPLVGIPFILVPAVMGRWIRSLRSRSP